MLIIWHKDVKPADSSSLYKDTHFYNLKNVLLCYIPELHDRLFSFAPDRLKNMIRNMPKEYGTFNKKNNPYEKKSAKYYLAAAICIYIGIVYVFFFTG